MSKLVVRAFGLSLDGFGAGPDQSLENPMGVDGMKLHDWAFATPTFRAMFGQEGGENGIDESYAAKSFDTIGAWILGRNMFGPVRGPWDQDWNGWWGDEPPYHVPVFVLTHYARKPLEMAGGTTFFFVTDGIRAALDRARAAANGKDIRVGGGAQTIRQYLEAGLMDEMHLAVGPVLLGRGESLFADLDLPALGYQVSGSEAGERATHVTVRRN